MALRSSASQNAIINIKKLSQLLDSARLDKDEKLLREVIQELQKLDDQIVNSTANASNATLALPDPDILIIAAETAIELPNCVEIANWCADKFFVFNVKKQKKDHLGRAHLIKANVIWIQHLKQNPMPQVGICRLSVIYDVTGCLSKWCFKYSSSFGNIY